MNFNYQKALEEILKDDARGSNPIPDPLRFSYLSFCKKEILDTIEKLVSSGAYVPKPLLNIDVPKPNFTIRPMARPEINDWIVYQSIIDYIAPLITKKVSNRSYSIKNFKNPKRKIDAWKSFDDKSRELYETGYKFAVVTDISGYYENIDLDELRKKLINYASGDKYFEKIINFLYNNFLIRWSGLRVKNFGLPQGPSASSLLGDLYLDNIDREMEGLKKCYYFRYMDDIRIFCKTEIDAKLALIEIIKSLRKYKLNINAKKTKILEGASIEKELFDPKKPLLDAVQEAIDSRDLKKIDAVAPILVDIFNGGFDENNNFDKRHIGYSIFRLSILKTSGIDFDEDCVVDLILSNFTKKPQHAAAFCSFLSLFPNNENIQKFMINFVNSKENIYEQQFMHVLRSLLEIRISLPKRIIKRFIEIFKDKNNHWAIRSLCALLIGKCGIQQDKELLVDGFSAFDQNELKQNIILSVQELGTASKNDFFSSISKNDIDMKEYINYIKGLSAPMYFRPYDKVKIDNFTIELEADGYY